MGFAGQACADDDERLQREPEGERTQQHHAQARRREARARPHGNGGHDPPATGRQSDIGRQHGRAARHEGQRRIAARAVQGGGDRAGMEKLFAEEKFDKVIHLAAQAGVRYSIQNPHAYVDSNVVGFMNQEPSVAMTPRQIMFYAKGVWNGTGNPTNAPVTA